MSSKFFALVFLVFIFGLSGALAQTTPKSISGGIINGKAKNLVKPEYPAAAEAVNARGAVNVQVTIDEEGNVISASAVSGHPLLRAAAEAAARASQFTPTRLSGQPVKVTGVIVYNFVPDQPSEFKEPYWALGIIVSMVQNAESQLIAELDKANPKKSENLDSILRDISKDVPEEFAAQRQLFAKLSATKDEERRQVAGELSISLKNQLQGQQLWQYELGENLGIVLLETAKYGLEGKNENFRMNESALRTSLQNIKKSVGSMPTEISPEFARQIKEIAAFADVEDLVTPKTMNQLFTNVAPLFDSFPD